MSAPFIADLVEGSGAGASLSDALSTLLTKLGLLAANPSGLDEEQVIKTAATGLTTWSTGIAGAAGGTLSVASLVAGFHAAHDGDKAAYVGSASFFLAATMLAIALIVRADLAARTNATAVVVRARQELTEAFIAALSTDTPSGPPLLGASVPAADTLTRILGSLQLTVPDQGDSPGITGVRKRPDGSFQVRRSDQDWVDLPLDGLPVFELTVPTS